MLRLFVEIDLTKPLLRGTKIQLDDKMIWTDFKYEHLPSCCFYCGKLSHLEKGCDQKITDSTKDCIYEGQFGDWLRAPMLRGGMRGDLNYREPGSSLGLKRPTMTGGGDRLVGVSPVSQNTKVNNREVVPRDPGIADQEEGGGMLVKVDEARVEGDQEDHRILELISQGEGVVDQAGFAQKTLRVEKVEEKKEFLTECMEVVGREEAKDTENL